MTENDKLNGFNNGINAFDGVGGVPRSDFKIMTPAEQKAKELIEWFLAYVYTRDGSFEDEIKQAKQCAIKVCDELQMGMPMCVGGLNPKWEYWGQVKTAINNYEQRK